MNRAFTLIETIMAIALTAIVSIALASIFRYFYVTNAYTLEQTEAVGSARGALASAMILLREASYGADGSYPIASAATSSITFYAEIGGTADKISYYLANGMLYETQTAPAGFPPSYSTQAAATSTIADYVTNGTSTPVFTYYDASGTALSAPVNLGQVASVETTLVIDADVNRAPVSFTLSSAATMRNLKNQI